MPVNGEPKSCDQDNAKFFALHLPVVTMVARRHSFVRASGELGLSPSAVTHAVRTVENRLGTPL